MNQTINDKLAILSDAAKYDVSCASSGSSRPNSSKGIGNGVACGICHSFTDDGRCVSLFKILMTNYCIYDCAYCINRRTNDRPRATFAPQEIVDLTIGFYRRNYIEGLFLSSGVIKSPDYTMERMILVAKKLRKEENYNGYIHLKAIPGASSQLVEEAGFWADRQIILLSSGLYKNQNLKRVYFSGYLPVNEYDKRLPALTRPPLVRENRLYQSDWLMRFYHFQAEEILTEDQPFLDLDVDPKLGYALRNMHLFPVDINRADYEMILRVPGIGVQSAQKIVLARRHRQLTLSHLKNLGVVMKRARYFITTNELPASFSDWEPVRLKNKIMREMGSKFKKTLDTQLQLFVDFKPVLPTLH